MSWADVVSHIVISPDNSVPSRYGDNRADASAFNSTNSSQIWDLLSYLYSHSPVAQNMLDKMVEDGLTIHIYQTAPSQPGWTPAVKDQQENTSDRYTGFNLAAASTVKYIDADGVVVGADPSLVLIHEIEHTLRGDLDPDGPGPRGLPAAAGSGTALDFLGNTAAFQNKVAVDLEEPGKVELSYNAVAADGSFRIPEACSWYELYTIGSC